MKKFDSNQISSNTLQHHPTPSNTIQHAVQTVPTCWTQHVVSNMLEPFAPAFTIILFRFCSHLIFIFACIYISVFIFSSTFVIVFYFHFDFDFVFNSISTFIFIICKFIIVFMFTVVFTFIFIFVFISIYICLIIFILISCLQNFYYSKIHCSFFYYKSSFIKAQRR